MRRMEASFKKARPLQLRFSPSLARRRQRLSQAIVRSTIQRLGSCTKPDARSDRLMISVGEPVGKNRTLIGAVGKQLLKEWKPAKQRGEQQQAAIAVLNVGGMDDGVQQQTECIDQNMPPLALDQLAGIEAMWIDASPPFSALFTL
jgi:hypothetical protein